MIKYEHKIYYLKMPEDLDPESHEWNEIIERELNKAGLEGWECYQANGLRSGEKLRIYLKRRIS